MRIITDDKHDIYSGRELESNQYYVQMLADHQGNARLEGVGNRITLEKSLNRFRYYRHGVTCIVEVVTSLN